MEVRKTASKSRLQRGLTLLALLPAVTGCGPEQQLPEPLGVAKHEARATSETMTPALRAAYIANVQATASHDYALKTKGDVLKAHNAAQRFDVEMGEVVSVRLPGDERLSFDLARVGCDGELRAVGKARPLAAGNRVEYVHRGGEADDLTEWYVHGPLGLEQGFTLDRPLDCGAREVVIDVGMGGSLVPSVAAQGKAVLLRNAAGRAVARYSDLYVVDAAGRELPSKLEVVEKSVRIRFDERGAVYPVRVDPLVAVEQAKLLASDGKGGDVFGIFVGISGDSAVIFGQAAAYVLVREGGFWTEQTKLVASDGTPFSRVGIDGDTVVVGAPTDQGSTASAGSAIVFSRNGTTWTEQAKLQPDDGEFADNFGIAVAISGDTIVVGAPGDDDNGSSAGAAYVFARNGGAWSQQAKLLANDGQGDDLYNTDFGSSLGQSVAISGTTIVAGAPYQNLSGVNEGAAYIFTGSGSNWTQQAKLIASDGMQSDTFGWSVGVDGDTVVVGGPSTGYVFTQVNDSWTEQGLLPGSSSLFGDTVAISGDNIVIGAVDDDDNGSDSGSAHLFHREQDQWVQQPKILPGDGAASDKFGMALAIADDTIVVGAAYDDDLGQKSGSAYAFVLRLSNGTGCTEASECASGYCVEGVCCNVACDGVPCEACSIAAGAPVEGTCSPTTGQTCDDGNACTQVDTCQAGACVGQDPVTCPPTDTCHNNCNPTTGQCAEIPKPDETPCDDGNACTQQDTCQAGVCTAASTTSCTALDDCHEAGACDPTTGVCDKPTRPDGSLCAGGLCRAGQCESDEEEGPVYVVDGGCACEAAQGGEDRNRWLLLLLVASAWSARRSAPRRRSGRSSGREVFLAVERSARVSLKLPPARPFGTRHGSPQNR